MINSKLFPSSKKRGVSLKGRWSRNALQMESLESREMMTTGLVDPAFGSEPPQVLAVEINRHEVDPPNLPSGMQPSNWDLQRSLIRTIDITFDQDVGPVTGDDLVLTNLGINAPADADSVIAIPDVWITTAGAEVTITVPHTLADALTDGVYQLEILPSVTNIFGEGLDGDGDGTGGESYTLTGSAANRFYRLAGDFNGDEGTSIFDFSTFAYWFGVAAGPAGSPHYVDMNFDVGVSIFDFSIYADNFGKGIAYPAPLAASLADDVIVGHSDDASRDWQIFRTQDEVQLEDVGEPAAEYKLWLDGEAWAAVPGYPYADNSDLFSADWIGWQDQDLLAMLEPVFQEMEDPKVHEGFNWERIADALKDVRYAYFGDSDSSLSPTDPLAGDSSDGNTDSATSEETVDEIFSEEGDLLALGEPVHPRGRRG